MSADRSKRANRTIDAARNDPLRRCEKSLGCSRFHQKRATVSWDRQTGQDDEHGVALDRRPAYRAGWSWQARTSPSGDPIILGGMSETCPALRGRMAGRRQRIPFLHEEAMNVS